MQLLQRRRFRRWIVEVVIPEGEKAGIDFAATRSCLQDQPAPITTTSALEGRTLML